MENLYIVELLVFKSLLDIAWSNFGQVKISKVYVVFIEGKNIVCLVEKFEENKYLWKLKVSSTLCLEKWFLELLYVGFTQKIQKILLKFYKVL